MCISIIIYSIHYDVFSAIHDQEYENVCWAYAISTMLRASIRSALKKCNNKIALKILSGNILISIAMSELIHIKKSIEILVNPSHHKMMRKELCMNIFPFGDNGADPRLAFKLVC